jgi:uncharacterized protein (TIGR00251 family)
MIGCRIEIKAVPNAQKSAVVGWLGDALKVKIHAPPVEGKANQALCEFLAEQLDLPKRAVQLLRGETSRQKIVEIEGMTRALIAERLKLPLP